MATSKGTKKAASKTVAGKKSAASKSSGKSTGTSSSGTSKATASARGDSSSRSAGKAKPDAKKSGGARSGTASKGTASKGSASRSNTGSKSTAAKSAAGRSSAASRSASARATSSRAKNTKATGDARNDLEKILQDLMKDIYYAEKKLTKALGKMAKNATEPKLKEAFTTHQTQTDEQITKLEKAFGVLGVTPKAKKCAAMDGLLEEADEHIKEYEKGAGLDAALIVGAQKVEHYEIASYGSMRSFAKTLGYGEAAKIFEEIREQESDTDELLTTLAESVINPKAEEETEDVSKSAKSASGGNSNTAAGYGDRAEGMEAGESSSGSAADDGNGREGGDDAMSMSSDEERGSSISGMTDGNNREGESETGEAMGY